MYLCKIARFDIAIFLVSSLACFVTRALDESALADTTLVMFLSGHGMPLPFAKTNCWYNSTRTPWIVRWPGKIKQGTHDERHFVSGIDLAPTALDALGLPPLDGVDGRMIYVKWILSFSKTWRRKSRLLRRPGKVATDVDRPSTCKASSTGIGWTSPALRIGSASRGLASGGG